MNITLQKLRARIDTADQQWLAALASRFAATREVGEFKRDNNIPPVDPAREAVQMQYIAELAQQAGVNPELAQNILRLIIDEVVKNHTAMRGKVHDK